MAHEPQAWNGPNVHGRRMTIFRDQRNVEISLTEKAAREIGFALRRLQQTTVILPESGEELADCLDFLMLGDEASRAKQQAQQPKVDCRDWRNSYIAEPAQDAPRTGEETEVWTAGQGTDPQLLSLRSGEPTEPGVPLGSRCIQDGED